VNQFKSHITGMRASGFATVRVPHTIMTGTTDARGRTRRMDSLGVPPLNSRMDAPISPKKTHVKA